MDGAGKKMSEKRAQHIYNDFLKGYDPQSESVPDRLKMELHDKLLRAAELKKRKHKVNTFLKYLSAIAATILIILVYGLRIDTLDDSVERRLVHQSSVPRGKPVTVTLMYDAVDDFDDVYFNIKLDPGIYFYSDIEDVKSAREHSWKGSLEKGANKIPFVVDQTELGKRKILVSATYGNFVHFQEIVLDASEEAIVLSLYQYQPVFVP